MKKCPQFPLSCSFGNIIQDFQRFLLRAYCFGNGGARTMKPWSARWFRAAEPVARKI